MKIRFGSAAAAIALAAIALAADAAGAQTPPAPGPLVTPGPMVTPAPAATVMPVPMMSSAPSPSASPSPMAMPASPPENTLVTERVRDAFVAWQHGRINRKMYSPNAGGTYIDPLVTLVSPDLAIGPPQTVTYKTASLLLGDLVYRYEVIGTDGTVSVLYALDQNGRIDSIVFTPQIFRAPKTPATPQ